MRDLEITGIEDVRGKSPLHALMKKVVDGEYSFSSGLDDPYRLIGYEVLREIEEAGETLQTHFVRVWIGDVPCLTITREPRAETDILNGGVLTVDMEGKANLIARRIFGIMKYYESRGNVNLLERPYREITEDDFFSRAVNREKIEELNIVD